MLNLHFRFERLHWVKIALFIVFWMSEGQLNAQSVYVGKTGPKGKILKQFIDPERLKLLTKNPVDTIWIIDVRSEKAYSNGHIPTARSFPAGSITKRMNEIPRDQYLIIYCTVGANAQIVSRKLKRSGYKRTINWGGISRWPWERSAAQSGQ